MKIPLYNKTLRFYLAVSPHKALSSFCSMNQAEAAYKTLKEKHNNEPNYYKEFENIIGIMIVEGFNRRLHEIQMP
jgi:hypothetical protein